MLDIKTLVAPVDFSDRSAPTLEHAGALADRLDAKIIAAHFLAPAPYEYAAFDEGFYAAATWTQSEESMEKIRGRLAGLLEETLPGREVEQVVQAGDPAVGIEELVKQSGAGLVVMPTHGYGPFRRLLLGSVTAKVLHDLTIPVFTGAHVPEIQPWDREPYKRIACAIGLDKNSEHTLRWAWELAKVCEEDLIVIHAAPRVEVGGTYGDWFPPETADQLIEHSRAAVDELIKKVGCKAEVHVASADPVSYVAEQAKETYADILVIGRTGPHGPLSGLQQYAASIIRDSPVPVISV